MQSQSTTKQSPGPQSPSILSASPTPPSTGEIPPPISDDIEEMLPVGFSELDAIAASPVLGVELLPPPSIESDSRPSSLLSSSSSYLIPPLDGPSRSTLTTDSSTLPDSTTDQHQQHHDLATSEFDVERGFWRVYHGARELLRHATIYQEHRDSIRSHPQDGHCKPIKPLGLIPKEIDLESMTQLSWGVTRAVADINAYDRRMRLLSSGRQSRFASPPLDDLGNRDRDTQGRITKRRKKHRHNSSRARAPQQHQQDPVTERDRYRDTDTDTQLRYNVCKACGTLHSPQWRYGPEGLLNLCNVCGLLHAKKTQRKMMKRAGGED